MKYMKFLIILLASSSLLFVACDDDDDNPDNPDVTEDSDTMVPDSDTTLPDADSTDLSEEVVELAPLGAANKPALGTQMDRVGRPAITTALVGTLNALIPGSPTKDETKNSYNTTKLSDAAAFAAGIEFHLGILDGLDTVCGNQSLAGETVEADRYLGLANVLASDTLLVRSTDSACPEYLGLEGEVDDLVASGMAGCGGRTPAEDIIDRSYSVLIAGALTGLGDGVDADPDGVPSVDVFPFLLAPTN